MAVMHGDRRRAVAADVPPGLQVVADHHAVEADLLGEHAELDELARAELLGAGLVADLEAHQPTSRFLVAVGAPSTTP